jgi:hypothetical protein
LAQVAQAQVISSVNQYTRKQSKVAMAELIVAGLAVAGTPPVLFAIERANDILSGAKEWAGESRKNGNEQKPRPGEAEVVLPNLLTSKNVMKGGVVKVQHTKPHQGDVKDSLPNLLKPQHIVKGNAGNDAEQKPKRGDAKDNLASKKTDAIKAGQDEQDTLNADTQSLNADVSAARKEAHEQIAKLKETIEEFETEMKETSEIKDAPTKEIRNSDINCVSKDADESIAQLEKTIQKVETEMKKMSSIKDVPANEVRGSFSIVEHHASNPYLLILPSSHQMEEDSSDSIAEHATSSHTVKVPSSGRMEKDTGITSFFERRPNSYTWHRHQDEESSDVLEQHTTKSTSVKIPSSHRMESDTTTISFWYVR